MVISHTRFAVTKVPAVGWRGRIVSKEWRFRSYGAMQGYIRHLSYGREHDTSPILVHNLDFFFFISKLIIFRPPKNQ